MLKEQKGDVKKKQTNYVNIEKKNKKILGSEDSVLLKPMREHNGESD